MNSLEKIYSCLNEYPSPKRLEKDISREIDILGVGSSRLIIRDPLDKRNILKLGVGIGIQQNKNEIDIWNIRNERNISHLLLPILDYSSDNRIIKMPFIETDSNLDKYCGPISEEIHSELYENGIKLHEVETGYYQGNPVAFDYGGLETIKKFER
jgi:hypothetical protein